MRNFPSKKKVMLITTGGIIVGRISLTDFELDLDRHVVDLSPGAGL